ncbi:dithiol-disulfide isomerase [Skermanella stibiiresistens SB22]|uniref:Dithiol-disulfide isomerase n=1 Tax=Skermanella stibiiresistens SB22 TaxID=1385369 RepID=W9H7S5_9PROT|nr:DsbA family oxidoreductase [Skermanella stibiiresistens]EWY42094.1 dithiol-disulfide isomerase [Skermanella stibiiresistens SB22]
MIVEIYSDLICPWCYIGKHRLERALSDRPRLPLERRWQPYELNPEMAPGGIDRVAYLATKFGGIERARQVYGVIEETAARDGIPLKLDGIRRTPNTLSAHRLVRLASRSGLADRMTNLLFDAYFVQSLDIGEQDVLLAKAAEAGLDPDMARDYLAGTADIAAIRATESVARQLGIQAVPCFIFNRRYALAGAQEPTAFMPLLDLAAEEVDAFTQRVTPPL